MTSDQQTILLTGFTGILGKRFAYQLSALGYKVVCPIRAGSEQEAKSRFNTVFHELKDLIPGFDPSLEKNIRPIPGDVREKNLGIHSSFWNELSAPKTKSIWHLAALIDLTESRSRDVYQTNFKGTLNVLEFAKQQGISELQYYSTFGSSGLIREGIVREIPGIRPPAFRNTYERTKWEAERYVWQAQIRGEISASIYRPSIIVGDSVLGRYEQFNAFNHMFDVVSRVRKKLCEKQGLDPSTATLKYDLRLLGHQSATLNIVPLDFVVDTCMKIYHVPGSLGRVYHIVNPNPPSLGLAEKIFKANEPWEGLRWEMFDPKEGFKNPHEKFITKQVEFLTPYLLGEAIYDCTNVKNILAFHGGLPPLKNEIFLDAIAKRGRAHGWQETKTDPGAAAPNIQREQLGAEFVWPEGDGVVVDFSPSTISDTSTAPTSHYTLTERALGKVYRMREKLFAGRKSSSTVENGAARDIVLLPFGIGVTRQGEAEVAYASQNPDLVAQVFSRMNQVVGFDLRAFGQNPVPGHESFSQIRDACCWAVADDLVHVMRLIRDLQMTGKENFLSRIQILPHSAGTYLAGWLSGCVSFEDMIQMVFQCAHYMSENETQASFKEVEKWFFNQREKLSEAEKMLLKKIREKVDPELKLSRENLADLLHGKLELVFSLNSAVLQKLLADIRENRIGVSMAFQMSPNSAVFGGNELEMTRFRELFAGKRKIELRRVPLHVKGTPHLSRLADARKHTVELLKFYDEQGRLRDPVVPMISFDGDLIETREKFIRAVGGIAANPCYFDQMINMALKEGGKHFLMIQSGITGSAGDLFEGIIQSNANTGGYKGLQIHRPVVRTSQTYSLCDILPTNPGRENPDAHKQSLTDTIRWYEKQLATVQKGEALVSK